MPHVGIFKNSKLVKRIEVTPRVRDVVAGDSIVLQARAVDASGRPVENARILYNMRGGSGEGAGQIRKTD